MRSRRGKHRHQVAAMASAGDTRIICDKCLEFCDEIVSDEPPVPGHFSEPPN